MPSIILTVNHDAGLHARPLAQFVKVVGAFDAEVQVTNLNREKGPSNGASPLSLLLLAVAQGHKILVEARGAQAEEVLDALQALIESNFEE
jgi:phosphotransferase system HPr (HPr) family protein